MSFDRDIKYLNLQFESASVSWKAWAFSFLLHFQEIGFCGLVISDDKFCVLQSVASSVVCCLLIRSELTVSR